MFPASRPLSTNETAVVETPAAAATSHGGGGAVLARAGLGDDAGLAHAPGQQRLAQDLVALVGPAVDEVLALEEDASPEIEKHEAPK